MSTLGTQDDVELATTLLRHFEWTPSSGVPGKFEVWTRPDRSDEVLVPLDPQRGDFDQLVARALASVRRLYGSEAEKLQGLLKAVHSAVLDSTHWKKESTSAAGLIRWEEGETLYAAAKAQLAAAAKSTREKRMQHGTAGGYIAKKFLDKTLMGQTQVGSFVITAHTPSTERFHLTKRSENRQAMDWRDAELVSGREILNTLENSLQAVRSALDEYKSKPNLDGFLPLVEDGVSAELVRGLAALTAGADSAITMERASPGETVVRRVEVTFDPVESEVLSDVAARLTEAPPARAVRITGEVSGLDNSTASPVHLVRLDVGSGAEIKHARVRLTPEQYDLAVQAHAEGRWVSANGTLERDGRDYWLYNASEVRLVDAEGSSAMSRVQMFDLDEDQDQDR
ncbi:hypothetical protein DEJ25_15300 [Curtobacterium sp. MCPF17_011]|uniref:hypothetical protein n=1 Tax=Curtobacterium sp. MCPF17_011 TaxID=2175652 RepID=UPI000DA81E12|nr:hypothetical protein [Curtobacterium sp. MCPF17_011]PZF09193.1 hypothetical protein DEJ25_15300 [Curtobacterium sp. MCPF17_011]